MISIGEKVSTWIESVLSEPSFDALWISPGVRTGENDHRVGSDTKPNQVWESVNDCSANVAMHNLINERSLSQSVKDLRNL